ncbi:MAG TPA: amino acid ABC transporter substrate-binding protein [Bacillus bacterium]|uniref:Cystine ABC transporter substrate-binding protein n=1 Tax=Siminovitchia fordii TaxID=254759 RepID=A0ABQ4KB46_9BACI|nr:ABC transporter substrate-binding protein [Siminovitchia fordii]GIN22221.1 cystine ABC transporter substrate-binding protein [Siminovitchia fordii]HBZ08942.1 amino acid ABC transporter substrate-binding protein [Bacillus sp. (in: firmicutes)]
MKRFSFLALAMLWMLFLVACGSKETDGGGEKTESGDGLKKAGVLRVGFEGTYRPFNFMGDDNKEYEGFDVDISNELAKRMGVETEFVATSWDSLIGGLKSDKFDVIIAQMTVTDERKKSVEFTDPYVVTGSVLITRKDTDNITKLEDIKGKKVGTGTGTTFAEVAESVDGAKVTLYKTVNEYLQDLINGRLDVIINDQLLMSYNIKEEELPVKITSDILNEDEIAMAVKKGNTELVERLNKELASMIEDGTYEEIYRKWFDSDPVIK